MSEPDSSNPILWEHLNHRCITGCPYCLVSTKQARIEELEKQWGDAVAVYNRYIQLVSQEASDEKAG